MLDQASFRLNECVNEHNFRFWSQKNLWKPENSYSIQMESRCRIHSRKNKIVKLYFFEASNARAVTVNGQRYQNMQTVLLVQATDEMNVSHFFPTTLPNIEL